MSDLNKEDPFCSGWSSVMSCDAMSELAKAEARRNFNHLDLLVNHPALTRFCEMADRGTEHTLQKTGGSFKKVCVDRLAGYHDGTWKAMHSPLLETTHTRFEEWTRAKQPRQPGLEEQTVRRYPDPDPQCIDAAFPRPPSAVSCPTRSFNCTLDRN